MYIEDIVNLLKKDKRFINRCRNLMHYHLQQRIHGKPMNCVYVLDEIDGKKKPFFNMFATLEDVGLHIRVKMDGDNFYGNIFDELVRILRNKGMMYPERDAAEVMMLFFKASSDSTKNKKNPFYLSVKGLYDKQKPGQNC